jgi:hypothetical protein
MVYKLKDLSFNSPIASSFFSTADSNPHHPDNPPNEPDDPEIPDYAY